MDRDSRAVAVVGTRDATDFGRQRAAQLARLLVDHGVTVVSGLAAGIDTAAHTAALDAGGRTIAVLGTGITNCYPAANRHLAERITGAGALVSQFWPSSGPARWTFPRRNVVTSGISQGTVVIEASATSGAKMQARIALEHHKRVWLLHSLVADQPWAQTYVTTRGARQITSVDDVITDLRDADQIHETVQRRQQLTLDVL
jgi:DNA processing protein